MRKEHHYESTTHDAKNKRMWAVYTCATCGGGVIAATPYGFNGIITELYPSSRAVDESVPNPAHDYLSQSLGSLHAPAGAIMLAASAVDAMLKKKGYKEGSLYARINAAEKAHLITPDMAAWAHEVRLDANDERHADDAAQLPNETDAKKAIDFALALAEYLFVLPSRIEEGRKKPAPGSA